MDERLQELQKIITEDAEKITELKKSNMTLRHNLHDCRTELCLKCGNYKNVHLGVCDECRWKFGGKWEKL